jgi:hypothetical protein
LLRQLRIPAKVALFYTFFETPKLSQIDLQAYVIRAVTRAIRNPRAVTLRSDLT